jgi:hypothetical protein
MQGRQRSGRVWLWLSLVTVLGGVMGVPSASWARATTTTTNIRMPISFVIADDPCLGEPVALRGMLHMVVHVTEDAARRQARAIADQSARRSREGPDERDNLPGNWCDA